jgi:hypothetical protein
MIMLSGISVWAIFGPETREGLITVASITGPPLLHFNLDTSWESGTSMPRVNVPTVMLVNLVANPLVCTFIVKVMFCALTHTNQIIFVLFPISVFVDSVLMEVACHSVRTNHCLCGIKVILDAADFVAFFF